MVFHDTPSTHVPEHAVLTTFGPAAQITKFSPGPRVPMGASGSSLRRLPGSPHHPIPGLLGFLLRTLAVR